MLKNLVLKALAEGNATQIDIHIRVLKNDNVRIPPFGIKAITDECLKDGLIAVAGTEGLREIFKLTDAGKLEIGAGA